MSDIKLYCGNCFDILSTIPSRSIDTIICDPPYNIKYDDWDKEFNMYKICQLLLPILKDNGNLILFQGLG